MSLRGDVCVVTGACGFLGKKLVRLLLQEENMSELRMMDKKVPPTILQQLEGKNVLFISTSFSLSVLIIRAFICSSITMFCEELFRNPLVKINYRVYFKAVLYDLYTQAICLLAYRLFYIHRQE